MQNYKLTNKGKWTIGVICILAIPAFLAGNIAIASYVFGVSLVGLGLFIYDFYFNR